MITLTFQISVADAMKKILAEKYAAVPQGDYTKEVRVQIHNKALQNENFERAFENEVYFNFTQSPTLDELDELITAMPTGLEDLLNQYDILSTAKRFSDEVEYLETHFCGHKMTKKQKVLCDEVWGSVQSWVGDYQEELEVQSNLEGTYEKETGKSCVYWESLGSSDGDVWHDTLPRLEDYTTNGYTYEFNDWASGKIAKVVVENNCKTRKEAADAIRKLCPVIMG